MTEAMARKVSTSRFGPPKPSSPAAITAATSVAATAAITPAAVTPVAEPMDIRFLDIDAERTRHEAANKHRVMDELHRTSLNAVYVNLDLPFLRRAHYTSRASGLPRSRQPSSQRTDSCDRQVARWLFRHRVCLPNLHLVVRIVDLQQHAHTGS